MDEIKKIAIVKEVNLTNVREQIKNLEGLINLKEDKDEKAKLQEQLDKGKAYLKDVEDAPKVTGDKNKSLKKLDAIQR